MSYLGHLKHVADIKRSAKGFSDLYTVQLGAPVKVADSPCLRVPMSGRKIEELFGRNLEADAVVYFPAGVDVRPNYASEAGQADILSITTEAGAEQWRVVWAQDGGGRGRGIFAAVKRSNE